MQSWIEEMSAYLKSVDPNHLVTVGEEGKHRVTAGAQCAAAVAGDGAPVALAAARGAGAAQPQRAGRGMRSARLVREGLLCRTSAACAGFYGINSPGNANNPGVQSE